MTHRTAAELGSRSRRRFLPETGAMPPASDLPEFTPRQLPSEDDVRFWWRRTDGPIEEALFQFELLAGFKKD